MRTMSGGPCPHYDCSNKNSFGYCRTTACINERYQQEQWGLPSTTNKSESVVIKPQTNADRIRSMTDEELATFLYNFGDCPCFGVKFCERGTRCEDAVLMKLREPVDNAACSADEPSEKVKGGE